MKHYIETIWVIAITIICIFNSSCMADHDYLPEDNNGKGQEIIDEINELIAEYDINATFDKNYLVQNNKVSIDGIDKMLRSLAFIRGTYLLQEEHTKDIRVAKQTFTNKRIRALTRADEFIDYDFEDYSDYNYECYCSITYFYDEYNNLHLLSVNAGVTGPCIIDMHPDVSGEVINDEIRIHGTVYVNIVDDYFSTRVKYSVDGYFSGGTGTITWTII